MFAYHGNSRQLIVFLQNVNLFYKAGSSTSSSHQKLIMAQRRTFFRSNYWAPVIARERSIVLAIAWYIGVELLRTKQLPQYITYTGIGRVPCLRADIQKQAARVYTNIFRKDDIVNKFYVADTGQIILMERLV